MNLTFLSLGTHLGPPSHHEQGAGVHPTPSPPVGRGPSERRRPPPGGSSNRPHCRSARQPGRAQASAFCASPLLRGHLTQPRGHPSSGLCPAASAPSPGRTASLRIHGGSAWRPLSLQGKRMGAGCPCDQTPSGMRDDRGMSACSVALNRSPE